MQRNELTKRTTYDTNTHTKLYITSHTRKRQIDFASFFHYYIDITINSNMYSTAILSYNSLSLSLSLILNQLIFFCNIGTVTSLLHRKNSVCIFTVLFVLLFIRYLQIISWWDPTNYVISLLDLPGKNILCTKWLA